MIKTPRVIKITGFTFAAFSAVALFAGVALILAGMGALPGDSAPSALKVVAGCIVLCLGALQGTSAHIVLHRQEWLHGLPCVTAALTLSLSILALATAGPAWLIPSLGSAIASGLSLWSLSGPNSASSWTSR